MKGNYLIGIIIVAIILDVGVLFLQGGINYPTYPATSTTITTTITTNQTTTIKSKTYYVDIRNFAFNPSTLNIEKGDTVIWTNKDSVRHTVTSDSGTEISSSTVSNGEIYSHTFNIVGTFNYHCSIHPYMKGTVVVNP